MDEKVPQLTLTPDLDSPKLEVPTTEALSVTDAKPAPEAGPDMSQLTEEERQSVQIHFNGVTLSKGIFDGKFYANRHVTLEATTNDGTQVAGWEVRQISSNGTTTTNPSGSSYTFSMPTCQRLMIKVLLGDPSGITLVNKQNWQWRIDQQQLVLTDVPAQTSVALYNLQGILLNKVKADGSTISLPLENNHQTYLLKVGDKTVKISK